MCSRPLIPGDRELHPPAAIIARVPLRKFPLGPQGMEALVGPALCCGDPPSRGLGWLSQAPGSEEPGPFPRLRVPPGRPDSTLGFGSLSKGDVDRAYA
jgi:hypothetical protein